MYRISFRNFRKYYRKDSVGYGWVRVWVWVRVYGYEYEWIVHSFLRFFTYTPTPHTPTSHTPTHLHPPSFYKAYYSPIFAGCIDADVVENATGDGLISPHTHPQEKIKKNDTKL